MANVFLKIEIDGRSVGSIIFKLYDGIVPILAQNFRALATGQNGFGYKGSKFDYIAPPAIQGGDLTISANTTGQRSSFMKNFQPDNYDVKDEKPGTLAMVTLEPGGLVMGSRFQIFRFASNWHGECHVTFGEVVQGLEIVEEIGRLITDEGEGPPSKSVIISDCGVIAVHLLSKEPQLENIRSTLSTILNDSSMYKTFLTSRDQNVREVLDAMLKLLDSSVIPEDLRRSTLKAMMSLCKISGAYPPCTELRRIRNKDESKPSGGFGDVYKGTLKGEPVCVKVSRIYQSPDILHLITSFVSEAILWRQCKHLNLLPFYGISRLEGTPEKICLISPWMEHGNVAEYLKLNPDAPRLPLVHEILDGLAYLHHNSIVHGNLKSANVLVTPAGSACLADFGLSSIQDPDVFRWISTFTVSPSGGTIRWKAPEIIDHDDERAPRPTIKSDIYALACVMYEVLTGLLPFHEFPRDATVMLKMISGVRPSRPPLSEGSELVDEVWSIMQECWKADPQSRPMVDDLIRKMQQIYPGPLIMMRWMTWMRKWQQKQVSLGTSPHELWLSDAEVDALGKFVNTN